MFVKGFREKHFALTSICLLVIVLSIFAIFFIPMSTFVNKKLYTVETFSGHIFTCFLFIFSCYILSLEIKIYSSLVLCTGLFYSLKINYDSIEEIYLKEDHPSFQEKIFITLKKQGKRQFMYMIANGIFKSREEIAEILTRTALINNPDIVLNKPLAQIVQGQVEQQRA